MIFRAGRKVFDIADAPLIMGILNVTPDSFYDGGRYADPDKALIQAEKMISEGADIIDVGGESTRPGSEAISAAEEIKRITGVIAKIAKNFDITISVDTYKPEVAAAAIDNGATIVNDIRALSNEGDKMAELISVSGAGVVLMHMKGTPKTMQDDPSYSDVVSEVRDYLKNSINFATTHGIPFENIAIDPGFGFGKSFEHNISLIRGLDALTALGRPVLIGVSRKSFIGKILDNAPPDDRLCGTLAAQLAIYLRGARIFRVHDVKAAKDFFKTYLSLSR